MAPITVFLVLLAAVCIFLIPNLKLRWQVYQATKAITLSEKAENKTEGISADEIFGISLNVS